MCSSDLLQGRDQIFAMYVKIHNIIIPTQIHPLHTKIQCDGDYCKKKNSISAQKKLLQTNLGKEIVTHL